MPNSIQKKQTILIVDDEPEFVEMLQPLLEYTGYETLVAYDGAQAVEMAKTALPHLILLDLQIPQGTGEWVLTNLRSNPLTKKIPILILSGNEKPGVEQEVKVRGAEAVLWKPFENGELLSKIYSLLHQSFK